MPKRVLNRIRLDKIAAVGSPCQEHARSTIIKRAPTAPATTAPAIMKRTFDEALRGQLVGERISEVFWRAFDKQYAVREAFREALADELAEGGDGSEATEGFTAAMRTIAETAATLAREAGAEADTDLESAVEQAVEKWLKEETSEMKITTKAALKSAVAAFNPATSPFATGFAIAKAAVELDALDELPADSDLAKMAMEEDEKKKDKKKVSKLERDVAVLGLDAVSKSHFDTLDQAGQDSFLAKSATERTAEIASVNSADPVLYKCADGTEIRKSDGRAAVLMAKRLDEQAAEIVKLRTDGADGAIEKRAAETYPNVAKGTAVSMLKSAATVGEDTPAGRDLISSLDAMNKGRSSLFKSLGSTEAPEVSGGIQKARADFNGQVTAIMKRDSIGMGDAMSKARDEHPDLFVQAYPENVEADA